jgi:hypothetical protein
MVVLFNKEVRIMEITTISGKVITLETIVKTNGTVVLTITIA